MSVQLKFNFEALRNVHLMYQNLVARKDVLENITQLQTEMPAYANRIFYHLQAARTECGKNSSVEKAFATTNNDPVERFLQVSSIELFVKELNVALRPYVKASEERVESDPQRVARKLETAATRALEQQTRLGKLPQLPVLQYLCNPSTMPTSEKIQTQIGPYCVSVDLNAGEAGTTPSQQSAQPMEDVALCTELTIEQRGQSSLPCQLFAIFDGHAGRAAADFAKAHLGHHLQEELQKQSDLSDLAIYNATTQAFVALDRAFKNTQSTAGCTATVAFILNEDLWVANCGDSRAILASPEKISQLTEDAKPDPKQSLHLLKHLLKRGGAILVSPGSPDVPAYYASAHITEYQLAVAITCAIGDHHRVAPGCETKFLSARPEIMKKPLHKIPEKSLLVIASDGIWDVLSSEQVGKIALANGATSSKETVAHLIVKRAFILGSRDNLSAIVVHLK